jgi:hypothetical protein
MNIKARAELLKKFIEICDAEIFPEKQCTVYLVNKSSVRGGATASYNNTEYLKMILFTPFILFLFALSKIIFLVKRSSSNRKNVILQSYVVKTIKIGFHPESYFVMKQKHLLNMDLVKLASIACHEVRHRVQYYHITSSSHEVEKCDENAELFKLYSAGRLKSIDTLNRKKVKKKDLECEGDAYFIQNILTKRLKDEFPDGSFSIAEFRIFIRENKDILVWRNSYLK